MSSFKLELINKIAEIQFAKQQRLNDVSIRTKDIYISFIKYEHKQRIRKLETIITKLKKSNKKLRKNRKDYNEDIVIKQLKNETIKCNYQIYIIILIYICIELISYLW